MALLFCDNFQQYGTSASHMLDGPYANVYANTSIVADPDPTAGGTTVLKCVDSQEVSTGGAAPWGSGVRRVLASPSATVGVMWRWYISGLPSDTTHHPQVVFTDSANATQVTVVVTPTGTIQAWRGAVTTGTLLGESSVAVVSNAWQHFECKVTIGNGTGTFEIRVDTVSKLTLSSINTQNTGNTTVGCVVLAYGDSSTTGSAICYYKDFAIWDSSGTYNNNFIGSCFVYSMRPDSDVSGAWLITGGAGSAWASINETNPDDDTKYIYSTWPALTADICTLSDLPPDATTVKGMMAMVRSKKSDGGDGNLQVSAVSGSSTGNGANRPITTAYTYWTDVFETDPATGVQWTVAAANACKIKFDRLL